MLSVDCFLAYVGNTSIGIAVSNDDGGIYERNEKKKAKAVTVHGS